VIQRQRVPFLLMAAVALLGGLWTGLVRIGWSLPGAAGAPLAAHGPLMVVGFVGTVIGLERAVAAGKRWAYAAPLLTGLGGLATLAMPSSLPGTALMTAGSAAFLLVMAALARRQPGPVMLIMGLGAGCWLVGNVGWGYGWPVYRAVPWWAAFPLLTIVAERLELTRFTRVTGAAIALLYGAVAFVPAGLAIGTLRPDAGARLFGVGMAAMALWLLRFDIARRRMREPGLPRFVAIGLIAGYLWLILAAGTHVWSGQTTAGYAYDAANHALFLGFVFSMIFVHAPIIFPSVTGLDIPFRRRFYGHLALLHVSLLLRVAGDALVWLPWRQAGALLNAAAIVLFFAVTAGTAAASAVAAGRAGTR